MLQVHSRCKTCSILAFNEVDAKMAKFPWKLTNFDSSVGHIFVIDKYYENKITFIWDTFINALDITLTYLYNIFSWCLYIIHFYTSIWKLLFYKEIWQDTHIFNHCMGVQYCGTYLKVMEFFFQC
jgi:hypothetical protein